MHPACNLCQGACCRYFRLKRDSGYSDDYWRWVTLHSDRYGENVCEFSIPCKALKNGKCTIYETRPFMCQMEAVGGSMCRYSIGMYHKKHLAKRVLQLIDSPNVA